MEEQGCSKIFPICQVRTSSVMSHLLLSGLAEVSTDGIFQGSCHEVCRVGCRHNKAHWQNGASTSNANLSCLTEEGSSVVSRYDCAQGSQEGESKEV